MNSIANSATAHASATVRRLNPDLFAEPRTVVQGAPESESEQELRDQAIDAARARGWLVFAGTTARATGRTLGEPDLIVAADGGATLFVELKSKTGKVRPEQAAVHAQLRKLGHRVSVVRSMREFLEIAK